MLHSENLTRPTLDMPVWSAVVARCEAAWPLEASGVVVDGALAATATLPSSRFAFRLCGADALLIERALRRRADVVLWHSHTTHAAPTGMSPHDIAAAAPGGVPLHPGVLHLVVDLRSGPRCSGGTAFRWHDGRFQPAGVLGSPDDTPLQRMPVAPKPSGSQDLGPT